MKARVKPLLILLCVGIAMALLCAFLYRFDNKYTYPGDTGLNGITLLDESGLTTRPLIFLARGWEFYQYKLLTPADFLAAAPLPDAYVYIGQYGGFELGDTNADPHGSATYRIRVVLPPAPRSYALEVPEIYSSCRVYVNGVLLAERGNPEPGAYQPHIKTGVLTFWAGGQAEIIVAASDYDHFYSGLVYPPAFGLPEAVSALVGRRLLLRALFCFVALLAGAVFLLGGWRAQNPLTAGYGGVCLSFVGYTCYPVIHALGWAGPLLAYRVENVCYCLTFLLVLILHSRLCRVSGPLFRCACLYGAAMCLAAAGAGWFARSLDGMMLYSYLIRTYKLLLILYLPATALYAAGKKALNPLLPLAGAVAFGVSLLMNKLLPLFEPVYSGWFPELGGAALVTCLGGALFIKAARARQEALALRGEMALMEQQVSQYGSQLLLQKQRLHSLQADIDETRRSKHDLRHHIALLQELLRVEPRQAELYLQQLNASLPKTADALCKNLAVDCVLRQYAMAAQRAGITMETAVDLPVEPGIADLDLCIVFSNLLENALEVLSGGPTAAARIIRVSAGINGNLLAINVDNSLYKPLRYRRGVLLSAKRDAAGVGLSSVQAVADKYGGEFWWRTADGMFRASVVLKTTEQVVAQ